ncbi:hypothetical protein QNO07_03215 [Streptomyces sp. 549]|uniref:hypothetical protein n=1 Tax=Streptomyces sp. 549 TaxID=3049076 RepID=UPI0024C44385|nr:hypothetical protein [Streptomyces sp. 549]MDK1472443.1 hypothetical protein [Streptomyces sp. 549]
MNQAARRIGRTLALVLPVVLVLSGTLAVTRVPWAVQPSEAQMLTAAAEEEASRTPASAPHEVLQEKLLVQLQEENPGVALTNLQRSVERRPSLAQHCAGIARELGKAAVQKYGTPERAQRFSRPVCDTSFASGVADSR